MYYCSIAITSQRYAVGQPGRLGKLRVKDVREGKVGLNYRVASEQVSLDSYVAIRRNHIAGFVCSFNPIPTRKTTFEPVYSGPQPKHLWRGVEHVPKATWFAFFV